MLELEQNLIIAAFAILPHSYCFQFQKDLVSKEQLKGLYERRLMIRTQKCSEKSTAAMKIKSLKVQKI